MGTIKDKVNLTYRQFAKSVRFSKQININMKITKQIDKNKSSLYAMLIFMLIFFIKPAFFHQSDPIYFWISDLMGFVCLPILLVCIFKLDFFPKYALGKKSQHLTKLSLVKIFLFSLIGFFFLAFFYVVGLDFGLYVSEKFPNVLPVGSSYMEKIPNNIYLKIIVVVYFSLTAGIVEEFFFRGVLNTVVGKYLSGSRTAYIFLSALLFACIHVGSGLINVVGTFFAGTALAIIFVLAKDIRVPFFVHSFFGLIYWSKI